MLTDKCLRRERERESETFARLYLSLSLGKATDETVVRRKGRIESMFRMEFESDLISGRHFNQSQKSDGHSNSICKLAKSCKLCPCL